MSNNNVKYKLQPKANLKIKDIHKSKYFDIKNYYVYIGIKISASNLNFN